jgi:hypothetical protein
MPLKKSSSSSSSSKSKAEYTSLGGRAYIVYAPIEGRKVVARGFMQVEAASPTLQVTLFEPKEGASEKVIASGFAKKYGLPPQDAEEDFDNPVVLYITLLQGQDDSVYALANYEGSRDAPPIKLSLYVEEEIDTGDVTIMSGKVMVPVPSAS